MLNLHFEKIGENNNKSLIILHGFMGLGTDFLNLAQELSNEFDCYLIDLPGHGQSMDNINDFDSFEKLVDHLSEWAKTLHSPHLFGYSMGGRIALAMATRPYSPFIKVIIESANPGIQNKKLLKERLNQDKELLNRVNDEQSFRIFLNEWYSQDLFYQLKSNDDFEDFVNQKVETQSFTQLKKAINVYSVARQENLWPKVSNPRLPSLYIYGEMDNKYAGIAKSLESYGWTTAMVKNSGHNTHLHHYDSFKTDFIKFIKSN